MPKPGSIERSKERHVILHKNLDELAACFFIETKKLPSEVTLTDFMKWSHDMTTEPTCARPGEGHD